jgi:hypothetical protein
MLGEERKGEECCSHLIIGVPSITLDRAEHPEALGPGRAPLSICMRVQPIDVALWSREEAQ